MERSKIVIFGAGLPGLDVATQLRERSRDLLLVDDDEALLETARSRGFDTLNLDYRVDEDLRTAGVGGDVGLLFALFQEDSKNVFLTLSARSLDPGLEIVSLTQSTEAGRLLRAAGANKVIDPYEISGHKLHELVRRPLVAETLEHTVFGQQDLNLAEVTVVAGSSLDGQTLDSLEVSRRYHLVLLGVVDRERGDDFIFAIGSDGYRLDPGDVLVVIGPGKAIDGFRQDAG